VLEAMSSRHAAGMRETLAAQNAVHHEHAAGNSATKRSDLRNLRHGWSKNGLLHMEQRGLRRSAMLPQQASVCVGGGAKALNGLQ
jgi:hypothetical protein